MSLRIELGNIVEYHTDAIVNAANHQLLMGAGVCGAIYRGAGAKELSELTQQLAPIETGEAVITPGLLLHAKYIIHAVGPDYLLQSPQESEMLLKKAYLSALDIATQHHVTSLAFPVLSSGIFGYPYDKALRIATSTIQSYLENSDMEVIIVVYDIDDYAIGDEIKFDLDTLLSQSTREEKVAMNPKDDEKILSAIKNKDHIELGHSRREIIIDYFMKQKAFDLALINETLFYYREPQLID